MQSYRLGKLKGQLCGACSTRVQGAMTAVVAEIMRDLQREEARALAEIERRLWERDVEREREALAREYTEAQERARITRMRIREARRNRLRRVHRARELASKLRKTGVAKDVADMRAAAAFGLRASDMRDEEDQAA